MAGRLRAEIKQTKPFTSREEEVFLNLVRTARALEDANEALLKRAGLSGPQYNVLRILRGAGADGLSCSHVGGRMVARDPDITRLLDRLEARKLVGRTRDPKDRRTVTTRITPAGLKLLKELDAPVAAQHKAALSHLGGRALARLSDLLERARERVG